MADASISYKYFLKRKSEIEHCIPKKPQLWRYLKMYHTMLLDDLECAEYWYTDQHAVDLKTGRKVNVVKITSSHPDIQILAGKFLEEHYEAIAGAVEHDLALFLENHSRLLIDDLTHGDSRRDRDLWKVEDQFGLIVPVEYGDDDEDENEDEDEDC